MAAEPTMDTFTKARLAVFAAQVANDHPAHARTVFTLQDTIEQRLPLSVQNQLIEKLNKDTGKTLAEARELINKDPKILDEINKNPMRLATIMGIKAPMPAPAAAPVAAAPPAQAAPAPSAAAVKPTPSNQPPAQKPEPAAVVAAKPAISDSELATRTQLAGATAAMTQMKGYSELEARAKASPSLGRAVDAIMGKNAGSAQDALKAVQDIQKDPNFFVKANQTIDQTPENMRENLFSRIADDPGTTAIARRAMSGDIAAKMQLMMGGDGKGGGLASLFGGKGGIMGLLGGASAGGGGIVGLTEMIGNNLPGFLTGFMEAIGPLFKGIFNMQGTGGLMMAGEGIMIGRFADTVDTALGSDIRNKPVVDATKPNQPATTIADLRKMDVVIDPDALNGPARPTMAKLERPKGMDGPSGSNFG